MAGGLGAKLREQPILAGCLGLLALGALISCGGGALLVLGGKALVDKASESAGVDGVIATAQAAGAAGFMFNVAIDDRGTIYTLSPLEPRIVTCDEVQALLFPHLTGTLETVQVESQSIIENEDGSYTTVPLSCTWGGWPGRDGATGVLVPPGGSPPATEAAAPPAGSASSDGASPEDAASAPTAPPTASEEAAPAEGATAPADEPSEPTE